MRGEVVGDRDGSRLVHGAHFRPSGVIGCHCAEGVRLRPHVYDPKVLGHIIKACVNEQRARQRATSAE